MYADVMDKNDSSEAKMRGTMVQVSQSCDNYQQKKKTEVVHQQAHGKPYSEQTNKTPM